LPLGRVFENKKKGKIGELAHSLYPHDGTIKREK